MISQGANKNAVTDEGERPIDLVDPGDQVDSGSKAYKHAVEHRFRQKGIDSGSRA